MEELRIGNVTLKSNALLAPMAGVTDKAYRELCVSFGAGYCVSEMVSSKALSFNDKKSEELMEISAKERPCGIQIFGDNPKCMAQAAVHAMKNSPDIIDINMGCPAPKISSSGSGSALMKNPQLCGEIVQAVAESVSVPITVKIRKGWDDENVNAVEIAKICEDAGAAAVAVHGRTRMQYYKPCVDYDIIKKVNEETKIPIIANGDIDSAQKAKEVMDYTGCKLLMIGRASLGNPWIFSQINSFLKNPDKPISEPTLDEKLDIMVKHISQIVKYKGEHIAMLQSRKLVTGYFKGIRGASKLRNKAGSLTTLDDLYELKSLVLESQSY